MMKIKPVELPQPPRPQTATMQTILLALRTCERRLIKVDPRKSSLRLSATLPSYSLPSFCPKRRMSF